MRINVKWIITALFFILISATNELFSQELRKNIIDYHFGYAFSSTGTGAFVILSNVNELYIPTGNRLVVNPSYTLGKSQKNDVNDLNLITANLNVLCNFRIGEKNNFQLGAGGSYYSLDGFSQVSSSSFFGDVYEKRTNEGFGLIYSIKYHRDFLKHFIFGTHIFYSDYSNNSNAGFYVSLGYKFLKSQRTD